MPVIRVSLSGAGIDRAISEINAYKEKLKEAESRIVKRLAESGAERAQDLVPVDTGELMGSIEAVTDGNAGTVRANSEYAVFVEFGTGVVGQANQYPGPAMDEVGYTYMGGEHHVTLKDGRDGWFYPTDDGGRRFTQGQPARPFMYDTAQLLAGAATDVVKEELQS